MSSPTSPAKLMDDAILQVTGGEGTERYGTPGGDTITTGDGADTVESGDGDDYVDLGPGDNVAKLGDGNDEVFGWNGEDNLDGGMGADTLHGGGGNDAFDGGWGDGAADRINGGAGDDIFYWAPGDGNDVFNAGAGAGDNDTLSLPTMNFDQLCAVLKSYDNTVVPVLNPEGVVTFQDRDTGQPRWFDGEINVGGEKLTLYNVERIQVRWS